MEFLTDYGLFLAKTATIVVALIASVAGTIAVMSRHKKETRDGLRVRKLNDRYDDMAFTVKQEMLDKEALKRLKKEHKARHKKKGSPDERGRVFILNFDGDIKASAVSALREEITAILTVARPGDAVFLRLHSAGGMVHAYGLAASQLMRIRARDIPLTIAVDKIAASGGYMMACVAERILAAPFAILGSIGVVAQIPNFNRLLKKHDIDLELITAGEYKRTLTLFGENTDKARRKFSEEIADTHELFKQFIRDNRPGVDIEKVATGEHWFGTRARDLNLVDELKTSDDWLLEQSKDKDLYEITYQGKRPLMARLFSGMESLLERATSWGRGETQRFM
ncbi:MAG TPA: protease SohB [Gammaproteobacteria bacterium]|nr:protease SohB [Gammaproteobacteria bacterium]